MVDAAVNSPGPVGHCPQCGYDQRGLPSGSRCPECGYRFRLGEVVADINRWADRRLVDLWSIAVLQALGLTAATSGVFVLPRTRAGAVMLGLAAAVYMTAGSIWYGVVAVAAVRRISQPAYRNMLAHRRRQLRRWLSYDAMLVALPIACLAWLASAS